VCRILAQARVGLGRHSLAPRSNLVPQSNSYLQSHHFVLAFRMTLALHLPPRLPFKELVSVPLSGSLLPKTASFVFSGLQTPRPQGRNLAALFSHLYKLLLAQPVYFDNHANCPGGTPKFVRPPEASTSWTTPNASHQKLKASLQQPSLFALLCICATANSRPFSRLRTLCKNHPGGGRGLMTPTSHALTSKQALPSAPRRFKIKEQHPNSEPMHKAPRRES
jgi:hypothetical protein